jgi:hypothetical protein
MFGIATSSMMICMQTVGTAQHEMLVRLSYDEAVCSRTFFARWCQAGRGHAIQLSDPGESGNRVDMPGVEAP